MNLIKFLLLSLSFIFFVSLQALDAPLSKDQSAVVEDASAYYLSDAEVAKARETSNSLPTKTIITPGVKIDLKQVFAGSPTIYLLLLTLSMAAVFLTLYSNIRLKQLGHLSKIELQQIRDNLHENNWEGVHCLCYNKKSLICRMLDVAIKQRDKDPTQTAELMKLEGKRATLSSWQRIGLLNDIAVIAPMLGLLGTVLGMFYAFYDINRSIASMTTFFDGLGVSVGTTVAGLIVALFSLMMHMLCKHHLIRRLSLVENETDALVVLINNPVQSND
jgi:biopolymer transport protein ExbB